MAGGGGAVHGGGGRGSGGLGFPRGRELGEREEERGRQQEGGLHVPDELERGGAAAACGEGAEREGGQGTVPLTTRGKGARRRACSRGGYGGMAARGMAPVPPALWRR